MSYARATLALVIFFNGVHPLSAQSPRVEEMPLRLATEAMDPEDPIRAPFVMPAIPRDLSVSDSTRRNFRAVVPVREGLDVRLPLPLDVKVSNGRDTILQYGDPLYRMHPVRVDLFWIGEEGDVRRSIEGEFGGDTEVVMSDDGFTAVAGSAYLTEAEAGDPRPIMVRLYSPEGELLAETGIEADRDLAQLEPLPEGRGVLFGTVPAREPLADGRLMMLDGETVRDMTPEGLGVVQKVTPLGDGALALIQGTEGFGLLDIARGGLRWSRSEKIRLVGPEAAALVPEGDRLTVVTGDRVGQAALYRWTVTVLDAESGRSLGQQILDGTFPGAADEVFADIGDDSATIRVGDGLLKVSTRPR